MYCKKCGKEINDEAVVCVHCGCAVEKQIKAKQQIKQDFDVSKRDIGILTGVILGLIGLIACQALYFPYYYVSYIVLVILSLVGGLAGFLLYPAQTVARKTYFVSCGIAYAISIILAIMLSLIFILC